MGKNNFTRIISFYSFCRYNYSDSILFCLYIIQLTMKFSVGLLFLIVALLSVVPSALSMEQKSLRQSKATPFDKVGLFIEGFTPDSVFRTKLTIQSGFEGVDLIELKLSDLKSMTPHDIKLFVTPSEVLVGSEPIVKEGMGIISGFVLKGSLLFSQMDSSSPLCKEFEYEGVKTTNNPFIYDGLCVGPITKTGPMETECRAVTALVDSKFKMIVYNNLYVYKGFYFADAETKKGCKVLASITPRQNSESLIEFRKNTDAKAVVVACKHGNGAAILSGIQLDQNASFLANYVKKHPEHGHVKKVLEALSEVSEFSSTLHHFLQMLKFATTLE